METLRWLSVMITPFMPRKAQALRAQLGLAPLVVEEGTDLWPAAWGELPAGTKTEPGEALFPRFDPKAEAALYLSFGLNEDGSAKTDDAAPAEKKPKKMKPAAKADEAPGTIAFEDFTKVDLRLGLVLSAEPLPKSDRLLKLSIDLGEDAPRQVLAGIREHYTPEALVGKRVVVVANLAPRKIMGTLSQGMVLAVSDDSGLSVLGVDAEIAPGSRVS